MQIITTAFRTVFWKESSFRFRTILKKKCRIPRDKLQVELPDKLFITVLLNTDTALTLHLARQNEIFSCAPTFSVLLPLKEKDIQSCPKSAILLHYPKDSHLPEVRTKTRKHYQSGARFLDKPTITTHRNVKQ